MAHDRKVKIKKADLISKITDNKAAHIEEYEKAVEAYREEAKKQLKSLLSKIKRGELGIRLELVTPVNRVQDFEKLLTMFNWEVEEIIEVTESEFDEYVNDNTASARSAKFSNATYYKQ